MGREALLPPAPRAGGKIKFSSCLKRKRLLQSLAQTVLFLLGDKRMCLKSPGVGKAKKRNFQAWWHRKDYPGLACTPTASQEAILG